VFDFKVESCKGRGKLGQVFSRIESRRELSQHKQSDSWWGNSFISGCRLNTPLRKPGVSVDIHLSYMKPAKLNDTILVEGRVVKAGNKMAYLTAEVYIKSENTFDLKRENLVATGTHTKFIV